MLTQQDMARPKWLISMSQWSIRQYGHQQWTLHRETRIRDYPTLLDSYPDIHQLTSGADTSTLASADEHTQVLVANRESHQLPDAQIGH